MKLAIVRQKYTPFGGAERFVARALVAWRAKGVDVTMVARQWQGGTWRASASIPSTWAVPGAMPASRARVQRLIAERRFDLVQSHERIPGCDIYRAGDGVHATWLDLRGKPLRPLRALASLHAGGGGGDVRPSGPARGDLQFAHGAGRHRAPLRPCRRQAARDLQRRRPRILPSAPAREGAAQVAREDGRRRDGRR
jgi:hypothetical protein